ncbi:MAG: VWA domain-containing protein [Vicinamibacterales bacterium]
MLLSVPAQNAVFRSRVDHVTLNVAVRQGTRLITDLKPADFEVRDNGEEQTVTEAVFESVPTDATMLVDMSASVRAPLLASLKHAIDSLQQKLRPTDRLALYQFNEGIQGISHTVAGQPVSELLSQPRGETALFDALAASVIKPNAPPFRQMLLLFTDGLDTLSFLDEKSVRAIVRRSDQAVFVVALADDVTHRVAHQEFLSDVADTSGGRFALLEGTGQIDREFVSSLEDFRLSYTLSYDTSATAKPGWHELTVRVKRPGRYDIRARRGYVVGAGGPG